MRTINISVCHQDDLVITQFGRVKIFLANSGSERCDEGLYFTVAKHLVVARLLYIQNLSLKWQYCLILAVASLLSRTACRISLDYVDFRQGRIALLAICQFPGQHARTHRTLAHYLARLACGFSGPRGI